MWVWVWADSLTTGTHVLLLPFPGRIYAAHASKAPTALESKASKAATARESKAPTALESKAPTALESKAPRVERKRSF